MGRRSSTATALCLSELPTNHQPREPLVKRHFFSMARIHSPSFSTAMSSRCAPLSTLTWARVKVRWLDVWGDRCWQTSGVLDAMKLVAPAVARIERMVEPR